MDEKLLDLMREVAKDYGAEIKENAEVGGVFINGTKISEEENKRIMNSYIVEQER